MTRLCVKTHLVSITLMGPAWCLVKSVYYFSTRDQKWQKGDNPISVGATRTGCHKKKSWWAPKMFPESKWEAPKMKNTEPWVIALCWNEHAPSRRCCGLGLQINELTTNSRFALKFKREPWLQGWFGTVHQRFDCGSLCACSKNPTEIFNSHVYLSFPVVGPLALCNTGHFEHFVSDIQSTGRPGTAVRISQWNELGDPCCPGKETVLRWWRDPRITNRKTQNEQTPAPKSSDSGAGFLFARACCGESAVWGGNQKENLLLQYFGLTIDEMGKHYPSKQRLISERSMVFVKQHLAIQH